MIRISMVKVVAKVTTNQQLLKISKWFQDQLAEDRSSKTSLTVYRPTVAQNALKLAQSLKVLYIYMYIWECKTHSL